MAKLEIVKYHNDINKLKLGILKEKEIDIFFSLILKTRDLDAEVVNISFAELKRIVEYKSRDKTRFKEDILSLFSKLKSLNQIVETKPGVFEIFSLFDSITVDINEDLVKVKINNLFKYMIDNLFNNFTAIDFKELVNLNSKYSKTLYRLLKQWETTRHRAFKINEFRELLNIPVSYKIVNIDKRVLDVVKEELQVYFRNLRIEKKKKGRSIDEIIFSWDKSKKDLEDEKIVMSVSPELADAIEKARQNRYIQKFLTNAFIVELKETFSDKQLAYSFKKAYSSVKSEIRTKSYLVTVIENAVKDMKDVVLEAKERVEEEAVSKITISKEKYDALYELEVQKQQILNNIKDKRILDLIVKGILSSVYDVEFDEEKK